MPNDLPDTCESPCIGVCRLDDAEVFCVGCLRSRSEIAGWSEFSDASKRCVLLKLKRRKSPPPFQLSPELQP